jgi:Uncharacterized protein conserved in bacteria (DUF2188)
MRRATYNVVAQTGGWSVDHNGELAGPYATKEAAFEAAVASAANAIKQGYEIQMLVPGSEGREATLGS